MKVAVKRLARDEKGQTLILALILLMIGGLIVAPLLSYTGTGLITGGVYERKADELYAADAGVEDAVLKIQHQVDEVKGLTQCYQSTNYTITGVNNKTVDVTITLMTIVDNLPFDYRVVSTATGNSSGTEIEAYIIGESKYGDYSGILDNVLTSQGEITLQPGTEVNPPEGEHAPVEYYDDPWPTPEELAQFYWPDVEDPTYYYEDTVIDLAGVDRWEGPLYRDGTLEIKNSSNTPATLTLTGTVYITGDTLIGTTGNDMTLALNGQTIFVASDSADPQKALEIGGKCSIIGPGIIIAVGDIYFQPNIPVGMTDPIFIMSVEGTSLIQPGGDFYGSIAGSVEVQLQPGTSIDYPEDDGWYDGFNFPIGIQQLIYSIASWDVSGL